MCRQGVPQRFLLVALGPDLLVKSPGKIAAKVRANRERSEGVTSTVYKSIQSRIVCDLLSSSDCPRAKFCSHKAFPLPC